jgi:hypothetical protein
MAVVTPAPRIGKFAGGAVANPAGKARKPAAGKARRQLKQKPAIQPLAPGLINR